MKKTFFVADHHLGHKNIIRYCSRSFASVKAMNDALIGHHNEVVGDDDDVYVVGDYTLSDASFAISMISRMKGKLKFMPGSHDTWLDDTVYACQGTILSASGHPIQVLSMLVELRFDRSLNPDGDKHPLTVVLCHYAMASWGLSHYGSLHAHGHHHGRLKAVGRRMDVGVDCHNYYPVSLEELIDGLKNNPITNKDGEQDV